MRAIVLLVLLVLLCAVVAGPTAATPEVTFNREIVPLLQQHCQECHRAGGGAGGGAPFVLERYEHVYQRRDKILESVEKRHMPPWKAVSGYGDLLGERRLSDAEIATVARWVAGGAPEGAPGDRPAPRKFATAAGIAAPDVVLRPEQSFTVPARGGDLYRCFSVQTSFDEDRYFSAADVVPGNSKIVHHVLAMVDREGHSAHIPSRDGLPGYPCLKGARVVFQLHYHNPRLTAETDRSELRLRAAPGPVQRRLRFMRVGQFQLRIPAGEARHEIEAGLVVGRPMRIIAIHPHMHLLGREMKVWAKASDDSVTPLIYIDDWDFHWQGFYFYRMPVALPVGSWIELTAAWDNSATNPRNPNKPPRNVYWGERTVDEMGHAAILYTFEDETAVQPR